MKKKTKLLILSVIASLAFTSAFAACGKKGGNDNGGANNSSQSESSSVVDESSSEVVDGSSENSSDVVDGSSENESSSEEQKDETAPVFSTIDETQFAGLKVGDKITIPTITATDETDGEVQISVSFGSPRMPMITRMGEEFSLDMAGTYLLKYEAWDAAENYAVKEIYITVEEAALTVSEALALGVANANSVTNGTIVYTSNGTKINDITFEKAEDYFHTTVVSEGYYGDVTTDNYYMAYGEDGLLWIVDDNDGYGAYRANYETAPEMVDGYAFEYIVGEATYYGVEAFLNAIYTMSGEKTESFVDGAYTFVVTQAGTSSKKVYDVSFTLNNNIFDSVTVKVETYYANVATDDNGDYVYDEDGNSVYDGTFGTKDEETGEYNADYSNVYTFTQATDGNVSVAYNPDEILVKSYTITNADGNEVDSVEITAGQSVALNMSDIPEGADINFDKFEYVILDSEGIESENVSVYVSKYSKTITVSGTVADTYTVTISSAFVTKELTVNVEAPDTTEIYAYANWNKTSAASIYDDGDFTFEVKANAYADASADVVIKSAPEGATGELTQNEGKYVFVPDKGVEGDYVIEITSQANDALTTTVTVTVAKAPAIETILTGKYQNVGKDKDNDLMLYMVYDDADSFVIATFDGVEYDWGGNATEVHVAGFYKFAYDENTKAISLTSEVYGDETINALLGSFGITKTYTEDANLLNSITLNADYTMSVMYYNQSQMAKLETWEELKVDYTAEVAGEYRLQEFDENYSLTGMWVLYLNEDGTGALMHQIWSNKFGGFAFDNESGMVEFTYTVSEEYEITISNVSGEVDGFDLETVNSSIVWSENMMFDEDKEFPYPATGVSFTFNGEKTAFEMYV